ncbi:MAG: ROK family protein [Spirochaetaceae bacterium]|nr:MAG: ROK family protein [Spirochaetaceae bacterium]
MPKVNERHHNLKRVFQLLRAERACTQAELKGSLVLQASTISYLVSDLKNLGFVRETGQAVQTGRAGKPGQLIALDNSRALFLGLYIEETFVDIHVIGIADVEIHSERVPVDPDTTHLPHTVIELIKRERERYRSLRGIGIAVKAVVDGEGNLSSFKRVGTGARNNAIWKVPGFTRAVREAFPDLPVVVENDANCGAMYCRYLSRERYDTTIVFVVNVEPFGIGCGITINGKLFRGNNGAAGEFFFPDRRVQSLVEETVPGGKPHEIVEILKESIIKAVYLIDPEIVYLTGSLFSDVTTKESEAIRKLLQPVPYSLEILSEHQYSLPAKGAVRLAADYYVDTKLRELGRR